MPSLDSIQYRFKRFLLDYTTIKFHPFKSDIIKFFPWLKFKFNYSCLVDDDLQIVGHLMLICHHGGTNKVFYLTLPC